LSSASFLESFDNEGVRIQCVMHFSPQISVGKCALSQRNHVCAFQAGLLCKILIRDHCVM